MHYIVVAAMIFLYVVQLIAAVETVIRWAKMLHHYFAQKETPSAATGDVSASEDSEKETPSNH